MKMNANSLLSKVFSALLSCAYIDSFTLFIIINGNIKFINIIPLIILNVLIFWDILTRRYSDKKDTFSHKILAITFIVFPLAIALPYLEYITFSYKNVNTIAFIIGCLLELLGGYLIIHSRSVLGNYGTVSISIEDNHELVKEGPYKFVRNPMYDGFLIMIFGYCICNYGFISFIIVDSIIYIVLDKRARMEEKLLTKRFGIEYEMYKESTGRYIPRIKKKVEI